MHPLKTKRGSTVWYSKNGVGKHMRKSIYVHKLYAHEVIDNDLLNKAKLLLKRYEPDFEYNCIHYDKTKPTCVRFDEAPTFDTENDPYPARMITVNVAIDGDKCYSYWYSDMIRHHKWLWVKENYTGFDVEKSWKWSQTWMKHFSNPTASRIKWFKDLKEIGVL